MEGFPWGRRIVRRTSSRLLSSALIAASIGLGATPPGCNTGVNRMSLQPQGPQTDGDAASPSMSSDGRYLVYASAATNTVAQDTNGFTRDVFIVDRQANTTTLVSAGKGGAQTDGSSFMPVISGDGSTVAFVSYATNLVDNDLNGQPDVFVWDRATKAIKRVSVASDSTPGDGPSGFSFGQFASSIAISTTGEFVAFTSWATTLVPDDSNGAPDVFVHDTTAGTTTRVSVASDGSQASGASYGVAMSGDGQTIAFSSLANDVVPDDTNNVSDVFVRDMSAGTTTRVSVTPLGAQASGTSGVGPFAFGASLAMTPDGRYLAFRSDSSNLVAGDTNNQGDVFVRDLVLNTTALVSVATSGVQGNGTSYGPAISSDGRYVAFTSTSTTLSSGDTNGKEDVFIRDRQTLTTVRVSMAADGTSPGDGASGINPQDNVGVALSGDGSLVAFISKATNLIASDGNGPIADLFVRDWNATGTNTLMTKGTQDGQGNGISAGGAGSVAANSVVFSSFAKNLVANDPNGAQSDIFMRDRAHRATALVSVASDGTPGTGPSGLIYSKNDLSMSPDGHWLVFASQASNFVADGGFGFAQIYLRDLVGGSTTLVSTASGGGSGIGDSVSPVISDDGRFVAFASLASNLIDNDGNGDCDVFVRDVVNNTTTRASVASDGSEAHGCSGFFTSTRDLSISADGRYVAFASTAPDLVANDDNGNSDVFVHDMQTGSTVRASVSTLGAQAHGDSVAPALSPDGRYLAFSSVATDLSPAATNGQEQVFLRDLQGGTTQLVSVDPNGVQGNGGSFTSAITPHAAQIVYVSFASNLVAGDANSAPDVFLRDTATSTTKLVSLSSSSTTPNGASGTSYIGTGAGITITTDGRYVVFDSAASNMVARDTNQLGDVYLRDMTVPKPAAADN